MTSPNPKQLKIERLQKAALQLISLIYKTIDEVAPGGIFRLSADKTLMDKKISEIKNGKFNFDDLTQLQRTALLKTVLRGLQDKQVPLFTYAQFESLKRAKESKDKKAYSTEVEQVLNKSPDKMNQKIAFYLLRLLNHALNKEDTTQMTAENLGMMIAPNVFEIPKNLSPDKLLGNTFRQNEIVTDLISQASQIQQPKMHLQVSKNRFHAFSATGKNLKEEFQNFKGDLLKSKILNSFKTELENATAETIDQVVKDIQNTNEYKVLATGQGLMTRLFHLDTSSVKTFKEMDAERRVNLELETIFGFK